MNLALLLKLLPVALFVALCFDGASVARAAYGADNEAGEAARAATQSYKASRNLQLAYDAALAELAKGDTIDPDTFVFDEKGSVTLTVRREADTVLLGRLREQWTELTVDGSANSPS